MERNNIPNFPDDAVKPTKPDFKLFVLFVGLFVGTVLFIYLFFLGISFFVISNFSIETEKKYFGNMILQDAKKIDKNILSPSIQIPKNIDAYLVNDDTTINAYAGIGANIYLTTALLNILKYEEEFVFILGHEINHIEARDIIKSYTKSMPIYLTLSVIGLNIGTDKINLGNITTNYFSRDAEKKADKNGIKYVINKGYNPNCIIHFFENKKDIKGAYFEYFSTHPSDENRIKNIKQNANKSKLYQKKCHNFEELKKKIVSLK